MDKRLFYTEIAAEMQQAADQGNARGLYYLSNMLRPRWRQTVPQVRAKDGRLIADPVAAGQRWMDHFCE
eukprot:6324840-Lingulodinium_polyedra.AAC.1